MSVNSKTVQTKSTQSLQMISARIWQQLLGHEYEKCKLTIFTNNKTTVFTTNKVFIKPTQDQQ